MKLSALILLGLSYCSLAVAQLDSNSITVTASNNPTLQPDQAVFSLVVQSGLNTGFNDVLAALQPAGITASNFYGINSQPNGLLPPQNGTNLLWYFSLPVPLANTKATVSSLTTLQQNFTDQKNGLTLSFSISGTQISQQLAQSQTCSLSSLIANATTQAQNLAAAGGFNLGAILALSTSTYSTVVPTYTAVLGSVPLNGSAAPSPCAITVKFNVTRNY